MMKSVHPRERNVLKAHLGEYADHMANNIFDLEMLMNKFDGAKCEWAK
jgi:hypothetical protein